MKTYLCYVDEFLWSALCLCPTVDCNPCSVQDCLVIPRDFPRCVNNEEASPSPFIFNPSLVQSQERIIYCAFSLTFPLFHAVSNFYRYFFLHFNLIYFQWILFSQSIVTLLPIPSFSLIHSKRLGQQQLKEFYNCNISNCKCVLWNAGSKPL